MKKLVCVVAAVAVTATAFGQAKLIFNNNTATAITNTVTGAKALNTTVALYFSTDTSAAESALSMDAAVKTNVLASGGLFLGGTRAVTGVATAVPILAQVRAWTGTFNTYEEAFASGNPTYLAGKSVPFVINLVTGTTPPNSIATLLTPFTISPVPEPSAIALGAMGLLGLYLIRRRR